MKDWRFLLLFIYIKLLIENSKAVETQGSRVGAVGKSENPGGRSNNGGRNLPPPRLRFGLTEEWSYYVCINCIFLNKKQVGK